MMKSLLRTTFCAAAAVLLAVVSGCAGTDQANEETRGPSRIQQPDFVEMDLAAADQDVRTVQLYPTGQEGDLPFIELGGERTLALEFDLISARGRPLSAYFYHADRIWRRDLSPSEYLESFQHDDVSDYSISSGTQVPYIHYEYEFPNDAIQFLISGNYIVRVTEQGDEEAVLFERAFFVTEQSAALEFVTDMVIVGDGYPSTQPIAFLQPPSGIQGNVFDYNVCFVRNGRFDMARCSDRPSLMNQPELQFYLEPEYSFEPEGAPYFLDLSNLRSSVSIAASDFVQSPYRIDLEPDYARFGGTGFSRLLTGQTVVSGAVQMADADIRAEYVLTRFSYVPPDERRIGGEVILTGSFNDWRYDPANQLTWVPEEGRYEVDVLIKQGQYEYRYLTRDRRTVRSLRGNMPRSENQYAAMVYYDDVSLSTDRLIAVRQTLSQ
jgi:hypothetical protein